MTLLELPVVLLKIVHDKQYDLFILVFTPRTAARRTKAKKRNFASTGGSVIPATQWDQALQARGRVPNKQK